MALLGTKLTRMLAAVAAVLTVFVGVPQVRCVCPDGRVKFFCSGLSSTACCCTPPQFTPTEAASEDFAPCCSHLAPPSNERRTDRDFVPSPQADSIVLGQRCGCERTLAPHAVLSTVTEVVKTVGFEVAVIPWESPPVMTESAVFSYRVSPRLLSPLDRVVQFCHFTC